MMKPIRAGEKIVVKEVFPAWEWLGCLGKSAKVKKIQEGQIRIWGEFAIRQGCVLRRLLGGGRRAGEMGGLGCVCVMKCSGGGDVQGEEPSDH